MDGDVAYTPPVSLWSIIKHHVPAEELGLVRSCIGEAKLDYCADLENELNVLLEIWTDMRNENESLRPTSSASSLVPEPPNLRDMLTKEIELLLENLRDKHKRKQFDVGKLKNSDVNILSYALNKNKFRPSSAILRPSTPMRQSVDISNENVINDTSIKYVAKDINADNIDRVSCVLRQALNEQCETLLKDIEFIQNCIEHDNDNCEKVLEKEPSIAELRQECKKLEEELLKDVVLSDKNKVNKTFPVVEKVSTVHLRPTSSPVNSNMCSNSSTILDLASETETTPQETKPEIKSSRKLIEIKSLSNNSFIPRPPTTIKPFLKHNRHCLNAVEN